ncbi:RDD family protein [Rhodanobacter sp. UC4436_H3]
MEIWIGRDGERHGPYKESDVREWLRSGKVSSDDLAWYEGLADWQPLSVLFRDAVPAATPPADNPYAAPATPLQALPQTTAAVLEDYAGFWKRLAAYILDAIVLYIPNNLVIMRSMGDGAAQETMKQAMMAAPGDPHVMLAAYGQYYATMGTAILLTAVLTWLYFAVCESSPWQATLGKLALGIRVTDLEGRRISFWRALGRYLAKFLSTIILFIGFMMAGWTRRKQALHDMLCSTLVLNGRASEFKPDATATGKSNSFSA